MIAPSTQANPFDVALAMFATFEVNAKAILPVQCPPPSFLAGYWIKAAGQAVNSPAGVIDRVTICAMFRFTKGQVEAFEVLSRTFSEYRFDPMRLLKSLWPSLSGPAVIDLCRDPEHLSLEEIDNRFDAAPESVLNLLPRNAV